MDENAKHPWERAGLGAPPYTWLGVHIDVGPHKSVTADGLIIEIGYPGQPMGRCAYCGQGIAEIHRIQSADGHTFSVGCDCVRRCEDERSGVYTKAEAASRKLRNAKARKSAAARATRVLDQIDAMLADSAWCAKAASEPHPHAYRASLGETRLDAFMWRRSASGAAGRARLLKDMMAV